MERAASALPRTLLLGDRPVGAGVPPYLIAEIGSNHNQDLSLALDMIDLAAAAGADAVKFQSIQFDKLYDARRESPDFRDWFRQIELDEKWHATLADRARKSGLHFLSSPTYPEAVDILEDCGVVAYKIASPQVQGDPRVLSRAARTGKPLMLSFGYCEAAEIAAAVGLCRKEGNVDLIGLHCQSEYPAPAAHTNLRYMNSLAGTLGIPMGFSDHTLGSHLALAAVALGACVIEKHVTVSRDEPGPDHHFAATFEEFRDLAAGVRDIHDALGGGDFRPLSDEVKGYRKKVELKAYAGRRLSRGENLSESDIRFHRGDETAIDYAHRHLLYGRPLIRDIGEGAPIPADAFAATGG